jgi:hypothetical protein
MKMRLSWTTFIEGVWSGGNCHVQSWEQVMLRLNILELTAGTLEIGFVDEPDIGPMSIELISENKKYLVTLLEATEDDTNVRIFDNPTATPEMIDILGDCWDARLLTSGFDVVVMMFKEFFEAGDVSRQWLN